MAYEGSVKLISGIVQRNGGDFPLVDASAVRVDDDTRLDAALDGKLDASAQAAKTSDMTQPVGVDANGKLWAEGGGTAGDVTYDPDETYDDGTVGKELTDQSEHIVEISDTEPASTANRIWVSETENEYEVPTMAEHNELSSRIANFFSYENAIPVESDTDLNDIVAGGVYSISTSIIATLENCPVESGSSILIVEKTTLTTSVRIRQTLYHGASGSAFHRHVGDSTSPWTNWEIYESSIDVLLNYIYDKRIIEDNKETLYLHKSSNIYNPANTILGKTISTVTGNIVDNEIYNISELFIVPPHKQIIMSAYLESASSPRRTFANACREIIIYKNDGSFEVNKNEATAYKYVNGSDNPVGVRFVLWGTGASRTVSDIYITIIGEDDTISSNYYEEYYCYPILPMMDNKTIFDAIRNVDGVTVTTDANTGSEIATITGTGSTKTWATLVMPCAESKIYLLKFRGKTSDASYSSASNSNCMFVIEFMNKDKEKIGANNSKYNSYILTENRFGYHCYGQVSPLGAKYVRVRIVTRGNTVMQFSDISLTQVDSVPPYRNQGVTVCGHLGMTFCAPQNTMPSFELGKIAGFDTMIISANATSDNVLVCLHNETIDATSDGTGRCDSYTYEELQEFDFGSWFDPVYTGTKIPKFEDVVRYLSTNGQTVGVSYHHGHLSDDNYLASLNIIKKYNNKNTTKPLIKSDNLTDLTTAHTIMGDSCLYSYTLSGSNIETKIDNASNIGFDLFVEFSVSQITDELIAYAKAKSNLSVGAYFGNEITRMKELIKSGVNMFTVDTFSNNIIPMD